MELKINLTKVLIALFVIFLVGYAIGINEKKIEAKEPDLVYWVFDCSDSNIGLTTESGCYPDILACADGCINMYPYEHSPPYPESDYVFQGLEIPSPELIGLNLCRDGKLK